MSSSRPLNRVKSSSSVKSNNSSKLRKTSSKIEIDSSQKSKKNIRLIHNPNNAILKKISDDLSKFDPDKLMLQTNPLLNSTKTIEQIQMYYSGIQKEMNKYQIQEQKKKMLTEKLNDVQNKIDNIVNPQKIILIIITLKLIIK